MSTYIKKKNTNIEFLRVIACFMVIILHALRMTYGIQTLVEDAIRAVVMPAVGIFWIITGYFFFHDKKSYFIRVQKTLKNILLPTIIVIIVTHFFLPWINGEASILGCITDPQFDVRSVLGSILNWSTSKLAVGSHLWYVFAYLRLVIWFPLIRYICKNQPTENKIRRAYLILYLVRACVYDAQFLLLPAFGFNRGVDFFLPFDVNIWYVLMGYELRLWLEKEAEVTENKQLKRNFITSVILLLFVYTAAFIGVRICRSFQLKESYFTSIDTALVMVAAVCIFYIGMKIKVCAPFASAATYLGGKTFYVYLIHHAVLRKIIKLKSLRSALEPTSQFVHFLIYFVLGMLVSFILVIIYDELVHFLRKHIRTRKQK